MGFAPQCVQVRAEDAHDDRFALAADHFADALGEVRLDIGEHPRVAGDQVLDLGACLLVVRRLGDADPVLAEVDPGDLLAEHRLADVRPEVADAGNRTRLATPLQHDALLLGQRRARFRDPVHEEVALLELREQRLTEPWYDQESREGE